jgi:hypothetical protein
MEDRVEIAREFFQLNSRRGIIHRSIADVLSREVDADDWVTKELTTFDSQSCSFYAFFSRLYEWYIRKDEGDSATHFWLPSRGNPYLAATYAPGREEKRQEEYTKAAIIFEESPLNDSFDGSRFKKIPAENPNELFAESLSRELSFYLGHVLLKGIFVHNKKPAENYSGLMNAIMGEVEILQAFTKNNERYTRAILEKRPLN